jgi:xanthine dehydrogenase accessory factor
MNPEERPHSMSERGSTSRPRAVIKGAGDLATGVALCLHRAGFAIAMTEIAQPTVVRRTVAFAQAVYEGKASVEGARAARVGAPGIEGALAQGTIAVIVAEDAAEVLGVVRPALLVDAIIAKRNLGTSMGDAPVVIGVGPGFVAGRDTHAVVETRRGHDLGRTLFEGSAHENTGIPGDIGGYTWQRVVRSPATGTFRTAAEIGDLVVAGDILGYVGDQPVRAAIDGVLRGLLHAGLPVTEGFKLGDVDPRADPSRCYTVSDKARAVGGGVLTAACTLLGGVRFETSAGIDRREADAWLKGA